MVAPQQEGIISCHCKQTGFHPPHPTTTRLLYALENNSENVVNIYSLLQQLGIL
jgi:hypothetical protein